MFVYLYKYMAYGKILFIFPDISHYSLHSGYFHYGLASISAFLKDRTNCSIELLHLKRDLDKYSFLSDVKKVSPGIVAFTSTTNTFPLIKKYSAWIKEFNSDILLVCGGTHAVICPEEILLNSKIDIVIRGDGEYPMHALATDWFRSGKIIDFKGIWYRKNGEIVNGGCSVFQDLDAIPYPDWDLFDYMNLSDSKQGIGRLMMSRGCPYNCSYCCNNTVKQIYKNEGGGYIRFKSPERGISEISAFIHKFPAIHTLYFDDDIFALYGEWFNKFIRMYKKNINKPYWCNMRPNLINDGIAEMLADSGCVRVGIGVESGSENIRNNILRRGLSDKDIERAVNCLKNYGLYIYSFNMLGIPHETKEELLDTVRMNGRLGVNKIQATIFYPYPKTELHGLCAGENLINGSKWAIEYLGGTVLKFRFIQRNRIIFTEAMINLLCKIYRKLPYRIAEYMLKAVYSSFCSMVLLPLFNIFLKSILKSKFLSNFIRMVHRKIILPPQQGIA